MSKLKNGIIKIISHKPKLVPLGFFLPSVITLSSIISSLTGVLFAVQGQFDKALVAIILSAIFDGFDGRVARLLKSSSQFGVELDSLADSISFGVAPAFIMYFYATQNLKSIGWIVSLAFAIACVLRLARFNVATADETIPEYWHNFFTGVPAPAGALLALSPITLFYSTKMEIFKNPVICLVWMFFVAFLMISKIPTLSLKKKKVHKTSVAFLLFIIMLLVSLIYFYFWIVASIIWIVYFLTIPMTGIQFLRMKKAFESGETKNEESL